MNKINIIDIRKKINLNLIKKDFCNLTIDPYIKEGYRRKHIARYKVCDNNFYKSKNLPLYQSKEYNPVHGDIIRTYPEYFPCTETLKLVKFFHKFCKIKDNEEILIQAQRITCNENLIGQPSVENWHRDNVNYVGVFCVERYNIKGGYSQFRDYKNKNILYDFILEPGFFVIFDDINIEHRVTEIQNKNENTEGYRDVLLFGFPSNKI